MMGFVGAFAFLCVHSSYRKTNMLNPRYCEEGFSPTKQSQAVIFSHTGKIRLLSKLVTCRLLYHIFEILPFFHVIVDVNLELQKIVKK